jgi:HEAT repeat protein
MRIILVPVIAALASGCGKTTPTLAGGKPVAHWVQMLQDRDPAARKVAVVKLGNVGTADDAALPALLGALKDVDVEVRCAAVLALVKFERDTAGIEPALAEIDRNDPSPRVRALAGKALARFR